jgi:hypothetical protein
MNSSGPIRTGDLWVMNPALLPTELRCRKPMSPSLLTSPGVRPANVAPINDLPNLAPDYECRLTPSRTTTSLCTDIPEHPRTPPKASRNASVFAHVTHYLKELSHAAV